MHPVSLGVVLLLSAAPARAANDPRFDGRAGLPTLASVDEPAPAAPSTAADSRLWIVLDAADAAARSQAADAGVSIEEVRPGRAAGVATARALERVKAAKIPVVSATPLIELLARGSFPEQDKAYHTYDQTVAELKALAAQAPDIASLFSIGTTVQGRPIWALRLSPDAKGKDAASKLPGALFVGNHHAREHLSNEVPLALARRLIESRRDPEVARLLAARDVTIVPMLNGDGVEYDIETGQYRMHRKNMRDNQDGSFGVDLNRNYGYGWGGGGASADPSDETYRGPAAFSEPETKAVRDYIEAHANLKVLLTYHTYSELVLYPWGGSDQPIDDATALKAYQNMAGEMGGMTGYAPEQASSLYIASGDLTDWAWGARKIFAFTFEMTPKSEMDGGFYPGPAAIAKSVQLNWRPMLYLIDLADDPRRAARVPQTAAFSFHPTTTEVR